MSIVSIKRRQKKPSKPDSPQTQKGEQYLYDLRRKRDLQVTGKLKPTQNRNLPRLKEILKAEGFKLRGNRLRIERFEATFEIDLKMGHVSTLKEGKEPQILCVTLESTPWADNEELADFDLFLLSVIYLLAREQIPESILEQLNSS